MKYRKMKKSVKKKWLEALRSGEYKQGRKCLRQTVQGETKHCCLGVLSELYNNTSEGINNPQLLEIDEQPFAYPHFKVMEWAGIDFDVVETLATKNDYKKSFYFIADWIEKNL